MRVYISQSFSSVVDPASRDARATCGAAMAADDRIGAVLYQFMSQDDDTLTTQQRWAHVEAEINANDTIAFDDNPSEWYELYTSTFYYWMDQSHADQ